MYRCQARGPHPLAAPGPGLALGGPDETKQGGQTSPTFHQTFVFEMFGEMFDLFDRGLRQFQIDFLTKGVRTRIF